MPKNKCFPLSTFHLLEPKLIPLNIDIHQPLLTRLSTSSLELPKWSFVVQAIGISPYLVILAISKMILKASRPSKPLVKTWLSS